MSGHELDITTDQLGIGQADVVVGLQIHGGRGIGCAIGRQGEGVGTGHHVGVGAGCQQQVAAEVAQRCTRTHADVRNRIAFLRGHGHRDTQAGHAIYTDFVHQVDGGQGFDAEDAGVAAHAGHGHGGIGCDVDRRAKFGRT